jgi:hypothetical protein
MLLSNRIVTFSSVWITLQLQYLIMKIVTIHKCSYLMCFYVFKVEVPSSPRRSKILLPRAI